MNRASPSVSRQLDWNPVVTASDDDVGDGSTYSAYSGLPASASVVGASPAVSTVAFASGSATPSGVFFTSGATVQNSAGGLRGTHFSGLRQVSRDRGKSAAIRGAFGRGALQTPSTSAVASPGCGTSSASPAIAESPTILFQSFAEYGNDALPPTVVTSHIHTLENAFPDIRPEDFLMRSAFYMRAFEPVKSGVFYTKDFLDMPTFAAPSDPIRGPNNLFLVLTIEFPASTVCYFPEKPIFVMIHVNRRTHTIYLWQWVAGLDLEQFIWAWVFHERSAFFGRATSVRLSGLSVLSPLRRLI